MAAIDIGDVAINRAAELTVCTVVNKGNPANLAGKITSVEIWAASQLSNCEVAIFFVVSGNNLSTRSNVTLGTVAAGSKQTFAVNLDVQIGDYIGIYFSAGALETASEGSGIWHVDTLDKIPCTNQLFDSYANFAISLYGTGATVEGEVRVGKSISKRVGANA